jgi:hypothetical protein
LEIEVNEIKLEIQINDWVWDRFSHDSFAEIARFPGSEGFQNSRAGKSRSC